MRRAGHHRGEQQHLVQVQRGPSPPRCDEALCAGDVCTFAAGARAVYARIDEFGIGVAGADQADARGGIVGAIVEEQAEILQHGTVGGIYGQGAAIRGFGLFGLARFAQHRAEVVPVQDGLRLQKGELAENLDRFLAPLLRLQAQSEQQQHVLVRGRSLQILCRQALCRLRLLLLQRKDDLVDARHGGLHGLRVRKIKKPRGVTRAAFNGSKRPLRTSRSRGPRRSDQSCRTYSDRRCR